MKTLIKWITKSNSNRMSDDALWDLCLTEYKKDASWVYHNLKAGSSYEDIRRMTYGR